MNSDPLGINKPAQQPASKVDWFNRFVSLCILAVVVGVAGNHLGWWEQGERREDDRKEDVQPAPSDKAASIVFVRELKDAPADQVALIREVRSLGIEYRDLDEDLPEAEKYLQYGLTKGVQPPMAILQDKSNQPFAVYSWPTIEQVKSWTK